MTKKSKKKKGKILGGLLEPELIYRHFFFLVFLTGLGIAYIHNAHNAEKKMRKIQALEHEIEEAKWKLWDSKKEVTYESIQSQTEKRVTDLDLTTGEGTIKILPNEDSEFE